MAKWTDEFGVFHDTDNLAYGDQGDTRYWDGKPGAVGSVAYDAPKGEGGQPVLVVVASNTQGNPPVAVPVGGGEPVALTAAGPVPLQAAQPPAPIPAAAGSAAAPPPQPPAPIPAAAGSAAAAPPQPPTMGLLQGAADALSVAVARGAEALGASGGQFGITQWVQQHPLAAALLGAIALRAFAGRR